MMTRSQQQSLFYRLLSLGLSFAILIFYAGIELYSMLTYQRIQLSSFHSKKSIYNIKEFNLFKETNLLPLIGIRTLNPKDYVKFNITKDKYNIQDVVNSEDGTIQVDYEKLRRYVRITFNIVQSQQFGKKTFYISDFKQCNGNHLNKRGVDDRAFKLLTNADTDQGYNRYLCPDLDKIEEAAIIKNNERNLENQQGLTITIQKCKSNKVGYCRSDKEIYDFLQQTNFLFYMVSDQVDIDNEMKYGMRPIKTTIELMKVMQFNPQRLKLYSVGIHQNQIETYDKLMSIGDEKQVYNYHDIDDQIKEIDIQNVITQKMNITYDRVHYKLIKQDIYAVVELNLSKNYSKYFRKVFNVQNFLTSLGGMITIVLSLKKIFDYLVLTKLQTGSAIQLIFEQPPKYQTNSDNDSDDDNNKNKNYDMEQLFVEQFNEQVEQYRNKVDANTNLFNTNLLKYFRKDRSLLQFTILDQLVDYNFMRPVRWLLKKTSLIQNYATFADLKKIVDTNLKQDNLVKNQMLFHQYILNKIYRKKQKLYDKQMPIQWGSEVDLQNVDIQRIARKLDTSLIANTSRYHNKGMNRSITSQNHSINSFFKTMGGVRVGLKKRDKYSLLRPVNTVCNGRNGISLMQHRYKKMATQAQMKPIDGQHTDQSNQLFINQIDKQQNQINSCQNVYIKPDDQKEQSTSSLTRQMNQNQAIKSYDNQVESENVQLITVGQMSIQKMLP